MRTVILCGGFGTRLWPVSRISLPKQFVPLFDGKSLLDLTIERILKFQKISEPIFICNKIHGFLVQKAIKKYKLNAHIFLEPESKNTCAAIYLAAKYCSDDENLLIIPSDHLITDNKKFLELINVINNKISDQHWITLGINPTKATSAYGYIRVAKDGKNIPKKVLKFIEKPSKSIARDLIKEGNCYWNAGIFIAKASKIIRSVQEHAPEIAFHCDKNYKEIKSNDFKKEHDFSANLFSQIPSLSIDNAVMEKEKEIFLYPFKSQWSDMGSWDSVSEALEEDGTKKNIVQINSKNNYIKSSKRAIATIGVNNLIIVDDDNGILISKKNHSEKNKLVVKKFIQNNIEEARAHSFELRPWGKFENLYNDKHCKVKKLTIKPKERISLQYHNYRSEHWLIVFGTANVHLNGDNIILLSGQSIDIPQKSIHSLENKEDKDLIIIETQLGSYFGEDDIIRIDDPYNR